MKKLVSFMLVMVLALSMSIGAFANGTDGESTYTDKDSVTITKTYNETNDGSTSPAETFQFTIEATSVEDAADGVNVGNMPMPTVGSVAYAEGEAGSVNAQKTMSVDLPDVYPSVGVYTYTIRETASTTAGVVSHGSDITLVVTVLQGENGLIRVPAVHTETSDGTKSDDISNEYQAGQLSVTKQVTGNMGDRSKEFTVTVTFNAPKDKTVQSTITYTDDTTEKAILPSQWVDGVATATITLKHDETVTFNNIPYGVSYSVAENDYTDEAEGGYDAPAYTVNGETGNSGSVDTAKDAVTVTNNKANGNIDTGIFLDNMPYIVMLVVVIAGFTAFAMKKRHSVED